MQDLSGFFAYPSSPVEIGTTAMDALHVLKSRHGYTGLESWEQDDIAGRFIADPIFEKIQAADYLLADVTRLNFNVAYEIGYAIGRQRRVILVRHAALQGDDDLAREVGIFDTLGCKPYSNSTDLARLVLTIGDVQSLPIIAEQLNRRAPIFVVSPRDKTDAELRITSRIKKVRLQYRSFDPQEQARLSAADAIRNVAESYGVVIPLLSTNRAESRVHNLRAAFVAGLAAGMEKTTCLLQFGNDPVPHDYRDLVKVCSNLDHINAYIADFAPLIRLDYEVRPSPPMTGGAPPPPPRDPVEAPPEDGTDWRAFPLLNCPGMVVVSEAFSLEVGLAPEQQEGVEGDALSLPHPTEGPYQLDIDLIADGFMLAGEPTHTRRQLVVSEDVPYPSVVVEAVAKRGPDLVSRRSIIAVFSVGGRPCGTASRTVTAVDEIVGPIEEPPEEDDAVVGFDEAILGSGVAPDLTIRITEGNRDHPGTLLWTLVSPHDVTLEPDESEDLLTDIGDAPAVFAKRLLEQAPKMSGKPLFGHLKGIGLMHIAPKIPDWVTDALRRVADIVDQRPTVLIASHEPYVPWELAVCEPPIGDACPSPFLGAQVVLGRWIPGAKNRPPAAPSQVELDVRAMAVIGCELYGKLRGFGRLHDAEQEVKDLVAGGDARHPIDGIHKRVTACFDGDPPAEVIHVALHGTFDHPVYGTGLVLVAEDSTKPGEYRLEMLTPEQVAIRKLPTAPFVFLNACQVGAGEKVLGDYGGLVKGFLFAGACAVIAPLWKINDGVARGIAVRFYDQVFAGTAPAELIRRERASFTGAANQSGTYLAYQFFGHPAFIMRDTSGD